MCRAPASGARGGNGAGLARILQNMRTTCPPRARAVTLSASRRHAISARSRRVTRTAPQSPGLVSPGAAGLPLGRRAAPAQRARQDCGSGRSLPSGESLLLSEALLDRLAEGPCWLDGAVRVRLERRRSSDPHPWLDALARPDRAAAGRGPGRIFRSGHLARGMRELPGDGRHADPRKVPSELFVLTRSAGGWPSEAESDRGPPPLARCRSRSPHFKNSRSR